MTPTSPTPPAPPFEDIVSTHAELRSLYRDPVPLVSNKMANTIDPATKSYIQASPFVLVATTDETGRCTVSPRGGPRGFVTVLDDDYLAIPDAVGNNVVETLQNVVSTAQVGLLFVLPGQAETLRVDGWAWVSQDAALLDQLAANNTKRPKVAIVVKVRTVYTHCSKSFERGHMWDASSWAEDNDADIAAVYFAHLASNGIDIHDHLSAE